MRRKRKGSRAKDRRSSPEAKRSTRRSEGEDRTSKGSASRREERRTHARKGKSDYALLAEEIMRPAKDKLERREERRRKDKALAKGFGKFLEASGQTPIKIKDVAPAKDKRLAKEIRTAMTLPAPPKNPYAALMQPMVIVPDAADGKVVIADAGSIVKLLDQHTLYRHRTSPITRRADELLVHYGKSNTPQLGWITNRLPSTAMKPSKGPTFLVTTRSEDALLAWEQWRLKAARLRSRDSSAWMASWLAVNAVKHPQQLREVTRFFGGKPIKNESFNDRLGRLVNLIFHTELDMATLKKSKKGTKPKGKEEKKVSAKKGKVAKKSSATATSRVTTARDGYVIRRLVKENPRRAGSAKAKIWAMLKKGMTIGEFVDKGGSRASVGRYVENGWVKLLKPKSGSDE